MNQFQVIVTYIICVSISLYYYVLYLTQERCFLRETGIEYPPGFGYDKWEGTSAQIECLAKFGLTTPSFIWLIAAMAIVIWWLIKDSANSLKIGMGFAIFWVIAYGYLEYMRVSDSFGKFIG